ncbi:unnamed protein product, partial [Ilex paraguariensis]
GYMAPEYALWGYLTYKADVYSFGVVALETVSGRHNMSFGPENTCACLLDMACHLQQSGDLMELVDQKLGSEFNTVEAERLIKVALLCTNASSSLRPAMSEVVSMLEGMTAIPDVIPEPSSYSQDLRFKAIRHHRRLTYNQSAQETQDNPSTSSRPLSVSSSASVRDLYSVNIESSPSVHDLYSVNIESHIRSRAADDHYKTMESLSSQESEIQVSTTTPSWVGYSSTSASDLYDVNI